MPQISTCCFVSPCAWLRYAIMEFSKCFRYACQLYVGTGWEVEQPARAISSTLARMDVLSSIVRCTRHQLQMQILPDCESARGLYCGFAFRCRLPLCLFKPVAHTAGRFFMLSAVIACACWLQLRRGGHLTHKLLMGSAAT